MANKSVVGAANRPNINIAIGTTGSGKSSGIKSKLKAKPPKLLFVWDMAREYDDCASSKTLVGMWELFGKGHRRLAFHPSFNNENRAQQFENFCLKIFELAERNKNSGIAILVEELADVTKAGWSPSGWQQLITRGRHVGIAIYGTSQRPALCDKTTLSQATRLWCGYLDFPPDVKVMAKILKVDDNEISELEPLQYIERDKDTKTTERGNLAGGARGIVSKNTTK